MLASQIEDLGGVPVGDFSNLGDLADPSKYFFTQCDVDRVVADAVTFGNLTSRGLLIELQGTLGNLGVSPLTGTDHVANLDHFTGHALFLAPEHGFGGAMQETSALLTGAASNTLVKYHGYGHADIRFSQDFGADQMQPILDLAEAVKP